MLLKSVDVESIIREDCQAYSPEQAQFFRERKRHIDEQIPKLQAKLRNFDQEFFAGL
jgi:hypothetical protein